MPLPKEKLDCKLAVLWIRLPGRPVLPVSPLYFFYLPNQSSDLNISADIDIGLRFCLDTTPDIGDWWEWSGETTGDWSLFKPVSLRNFLFTQSLLALFSSFLESKDTFLNTYSLILCSYSLIKPTLQYVPNFSFCFFTTVNIFSWNEFMFSDVLSNFFL